MKDGYYWKLTVRAGNKFDPNQPRVPAGNPRGGQWTAATHSDYVQLQRDIRANYPQPVRDAIEEKVRAKFAAEGRELTEHQIEMYLDAMALGEEQFLHYGEQIGLDDPIGMFVDYNIEQKVVDMETQRQIYDMKWNATYKGTPQDHVKEWDRYYEPRQSFAKTLTELHRDYGVVVYNNSNASNDEIAKGAGYLLNLARDNPAIATILKENVQTLRYETRQEGNTAAAQWRAGSDEIVIPFAEGDFPVYPAVLVHEIGHAASRYMGGNLVLNKLGYGQGRTASLYGATNTSEDWAEWFVGAFTRSPGLDKWDGDKYKHARDILDQLGGTVH